MDFHQLCLRVLALNGNGAFLHYAKGYARKGLSLYDEEAIQRQVLYILSNLRGKGTKELREGFKALMV